VQKTLFNHKYKTRS